MKWIFVPERIKIVRESKGLEQSQMSKTCGFTQQQLSQWEKGEITPGQESLLKICNTLEVTPAFFFAESN